MGRSTVVWTAMQTLAWSHGGPEVMVWLQHGLLPVLWNQVQICHIGIHIGKIDVEFHNVQFICMVLQSFIDVYTYIQSTVTWWWMLVAYNPRKAAWTESLVQEAYAWNSTPTQTTNQILVNTQIRYIYNILSWYKVEYIYIYTYDFVSLVLHNYIYYIYIYTYIVFMS